MNLSAVILAGGQSLRMGRDKAWLEIEGQPLLARLVDTVQALEIREIYISGRAGVDYSRVHRPVLFDRDPGLGPLGGIERALSVCDAPLLLVLAVDLPCMTTEFLQWLATRSDPMTGAIPTLHGQLEPLAAIYPKRAHALACDAIAQGRRAARTFASACLRERLAQAVEVRADDFGCFVNWNRPDDLRDPTAGAA